MLAFAVRLSIWGATCYTKKKRERTGSTTTRRNAIIDQIVTLSDYFITPALKKMLRELEEKRRSYYRYYNPMKGLLVSLGFLVTFWVGCWIARRSSIIINDVDVIGVSIAWIWVVVGLSLLLDRKARMFKLRMDEELMLHMLRVLQNFSIYVLEMRTEIRAEYRKALVKTAEDLNALTSKIQHTF